MPIDTNPSVYNDLFFQSLIEGYVTNNKRFLRRDWLAAEIDTHLAGPACHFVLLTAEPGFGKSVFMAQLADDHPDWPRYFIRRDQRSPLADVGSRSFLLRIGYQLAARYPELFDKDAVRLSVEQRIGDVADRSTVVGAEIQKIVASPFHVNISKLVEIRQQVANVAGYVVGLRIGELAIEPHLLDSVALQHMALIEPARAMQRLHPDCQIVILIDALDEIRYHQTEDNILTWLRNCPDLPANVHFVLTARPPADDVRLFIDKQQSALHKIDLTSQGGEPAAKLHYQPLNDVVIYVAALAENAQIKPHLEAQPDGVVGFKQQAVAKADGNIGYLDALARAIDQSLSHQDEKSLAALLAVKSLPDDIQGLYVFFLHQLKVKVGDIKVLIEMLATGARDFVLMWSAVYEPFLAVLAVAREPVTLEQIQRLGGITAQWSDLNTAKDNLLQFLDVVGNRYRLYHATLPEFLTDEHTKENSEQQDLYIDAENWHQRIGRFYWQTCHDDWSRCDDYGLAHLPAHLSAASMATELHSMLFGFGWLRTKLARLRINALLADFSLPGAECSTAVQDLHTALRQGAHVLGQTPDQLASQLHGRLCDNPNVEIKNLLKQAVHGQATPWLRPMTPSLNDPNALRYTLEGHEAWINAIVIDRDGHLAISASNDQTLKVWDIVNGKELCTLRGHTGAVNSVVLSQDGQIAVSASDDRTLKIWDVVNVRQLRTLEGHTDQVNCVAMSVDEQLVVSASDDKTIRLWDVGNGHMIRTLIGHSNPVYTVAFCRDSKLVISTSKEGTLKFWDIATGNELTSLENFIGGFCGTATSTDGRLSVFNSGLGQLHVVDMIKNETIYRFAPSLLVYSIAMSGDGRRVASVTDELTVWDTSNGKEVQILTNQATVDTVLAMNWDGKVVVSTAMNRTMLRVWNVGSSGEECPLKHHSLMVNSVTISDDGRLAVSASIDKKIKVWEMKNGKELNTLAGHTDSVNSVAISSDSRLAISAADDKTLKVWDVTTGRELRTFYGHEDKVTSVAISKDGRVAISASQDNKLKVWGVIHKHLWKLWQGVQWLNFHTLKVWLLAAGYEQHTLQGHTDWVTGVAVSGDGRLAVSVSRDRTRRVWDMSSGAELRMLDGNSSVYGHIAMTEDGRQVVSDTWETSLTLWDVASGRELHTFEGHTDWVVGIAISKDGKLAVSASRDRTIKLWDTLTGLCVASFVADGVMNTCAISSDGVTIVAGGESGQIHFLKLERLTRSD